MERKTRRDFKENAMEIDGHLKEIRQQFSDQVRSLDFRLENHVSMLSELQDFYRKRAELELEYSRNMDKLVKQITTRHNDKQKRDTWPGYSTYTIWQALLGTTRKMGRDHGVLSELYNTQMCARLAELSEDMQRIYKKCREMILHSHEELTKVLTELQSSTKTYQIYHSEYLQAETKYRTVENQRSKIEQAGKGVLTRKFRNVEKQSEKKQRKYLESKLKAVKARNEYILSMEAANAAMRKYFIEDLQELINTMDYGYHSTLGRAVMMHISAEDSMMKSRQGCLDLINQRVRNLDQRIDKQTFLDIFSQPFVQPKEFEFQPHRGDEVCHLSAQKFVQDDLIDRLNTISVRLNSLRVENDEIWKTLETTDNRLLEMVTRKDYDVSRYFLNDCQGLPPPRSPIERDKIRCDRLETEEFYLNKYQDFQTASNLIARLQAKHNCIEKALSVSDCLHIQASSPSLCSKRIPSVPPKPKRRKALGKAPLVGQPRLFGGTIEDYVEATGEDIPLVIRSCVQFLNLYGMHHQGVFRVPGSQLEISEFKNQFERGKDPLPDGKVEGKDVNSVAGVLKLYFRELRESLFPQRLFDLLIDFCTTHTFNNQDELLECVSHLRQLLLTSLPRAVIIVMRYLFAFLNHLSEFSDENMMDPYNLSICFGPTLAPVPPEFDAHQYQSLTSELVKNIIIHQEDIFPRDGGTLYEKCLVEVEGAHDESLDNLSEDEEVNGETASEEDVFYESEIKDAQALYDFHGRTDRELSFKKGDAIILFEKVSKDWWEGSARGQEGLIPDKYIAVSQRLAEHNLEREKVEEINEKSKDQERRKSSESLPSKSLSHLMVTLDEAAPNELSASHPNVSLGTSPPPRPPIISTSSSSSSRTDEDTSTSSIPDRVDSEKLNGQVSASVPVKGVVKLEDEHKTPEDLALDIDEALAQVMSGIQSLGLQQGVKIDGVMLKGSSEFKHTPDLVIDLPIGSVQQLPSPGSAVVSEESPTLTTAEVFANVNQCTIKKGTSTAPQAVNQTETKAAVIKKSVLVEPETRKKTREGPITRLKLTDISLEGSALTTVVRSSRMSHPVQPHSPTSGPPNPVPRISRSASERISTASWTTFATDINLDTEFVRSFEPPFKATSASSRRSYSPRTSEASSPPELAVFGGSTGVTPRPDAVSVLSQSSPERKTVVKPPIKAKPPIMKKPVRAGELTKHIPNVPATPGHSSVQQPPLA